MSSGFLSCLRAQLRAPSNLSNIKELWYRGASWALNWTPVIPIGVIFSIANVNFEDFFSQYNFMFWPRPNYRYADPSPLEMALLA